MGRRRETTDRKEREGVLGREGGEERAEEKFSCGEKQMRKTECLNDWARETKSGRKPVAF